MEPPSPERPPLCGLAIGGGQSGRDLQAAPGGWHPRLPDITTTALRGRPGGAKAAPLPKPCRLRSRSQQPARFPSEAAEACRPAMPPGGASANRPSLTGSARRSARLARPALTGSARRSRRRSPQTLRRPAGSQRLQPPPPTVPSFPHGRRRLKKPNAGWQRRAPGFSPCRSPANPRRVRQKGRGRTPRPLSLRLFSIRSVVVFFSSRPPLE